MKILIASDKFKGSLTASEACGAIRSGLAQTDHEVRCIPVADGGDGMAATLTDAFEGEWCRIEVSDPLGEPARAGYGLIDQGATAVVEMAEASGIALLGERRKDPWKASTLGTGQLLRDAMGRGVEKVILGIGGSATNDGGTGMARALGFRFLDSAGDEVIDVPADLFNVSSIHPPVEQSGFPAVTVACDVVNPLLGPDGCTRIYGPQKGISEEHFDKHERRLKHLTSLLGEGGKTAAEASGSGAAGGLGFGCLVFLNATLVPGFELVSRVLDLDASVQWADIVITGEGKIDAQSLAGKAPAGVAALARKYGRKVYGFCGVLDDRGLGDCFDEVFAIDRGDRTVEESMRQGAELLQQTVEKAAGKLLA